MDMSTASHRSPDSHNFRPRYLRPEAKEQSEPGDEAVPESFRNLVPKAKRDPNRKLPAAPVSNETFRQHAYEQLGIWLTESIGAMVAFPLTRVGTLMQCRLAVSSQTAVDESIAVRDPRDIGKIRNKQGVAALWLGSSALFMQLLGRRLLVVVLTESPKEVQFYAMLFSPLLLLALHPFEVLATRMMCQWPEISFTGVYDCAKRTVAEAGYVSLFAGALAGATRAVVRNTAFRLLLHSSRSVPMQKPSVLSAYLFSCFLQLTSSYISYPFDTIARVQMMRPELSLREAALLIYNRGGLQAFWSGWVSKSISEQVDDLSQAIVSEVVESYGLGKPARNQR